MKNITDEEFAARKRAALEKVLPHMLKPDVYPMPAVSLDECAVLLSASASGMFSTADIRKTEHCALEKIRRGLETVGVRRVSDAFG